MVFIEDILYYIIISLDINQDAESYTTIFQVLIDAYLRQKAFLYFIDTAV